MVRCQLEKLLAVVCILWRCYFLDCFKKGFKHFYLIRKKAVEISTIDQSGHLKIFGYNLMDFILLTEND